MRLKSAIIFVRSKEVSSVSSGFYYFKANYDEIHLDEQSHFTMNEYRDCRQKHLASPSLGSSSQNTSQIGRFDVTHGLVAGCSPLR